MNAGTRAAVLERSRGLLCGECNTAIGKLGDSVEGLLLAVEYLGRT